VYEQSKTGWICASHVIICWADALQPGTRQAVKHCPSLPDIHVLYLKHMLLWLQTMLCCVPPCTCRDFTQLVEFHRQTNAVSAGGVSLPRPCVLLGGPHLPSMSLHDSSAATLKSQLCHAPILAHHLRTVWQSGVLSSCVVPLQDLTIVARTVEECMVDHVGCIKLGPGATVMSFEEKPQVGQGGRRCLGAPIDCEATTGIAGCMSGPTVMGVAPL
jgi:hypothetical protein